MKQRSVASVVLLTIFTLGIYSIFWLYYTKQELVQRGQKIPSMWMLFLPSLTIIMLFIIAAIGGTFSTHYGTTASNSSTFGVLMLVVLPLYVFAMFYPLFWYYQYCKAASVVTGNRAKLDNSYALYVVTWFFGLTLPLWVGYLQSEYNKTAPISVGASPNPQLAAFNEQENPSNWLNPQSGPRFTKKKSAKD